MKIHEYQAKQLLASYGIGSPEGYLAENAQEAYEAAVKLGGTCVVKAQIHSGGRGKAGGVKLVKSAQEAKEVSEKLLGSTLVTKQTGPEGKVVNKLFVTAAVDVEKEFYLSLTVDNDGAGLVIIASADGGTEIEEVAEKNPERIIKQPVSVMMGIKDYQIRAVADALGLPNELLKPFNAMMKNMYKLFMEKDCSLIEINPLVITGEGELCVLDAKVTFDDNAMFRHPDMALLRDIAEENPKEVEASKYDLNYIQLEGNIGCMVNGAGLAMATMDIIQSCGGRPANFLDVGGGATAEKVAGAFEILLSDSNVKAIMVNIFGGIMKCDTIADGIVEAAKKLGVKVPLVVRLEGTNADLGKEILDKSGLDIISAGDIAEAARLSVARV